MNRAIIAALVAAIAIGSALGAFAATRTIETTANVDVRVWRRISDGELFLSTRAEGGEWVTHSDALDVTELDRTGRFQLSKLVRVLVPVEVEVGGSGCSPVRAHPAPRAGVVTE